MPSVPSLLRLLAMELSTQGWPLFDVLVLLKAGEVLARVERSFTNLTKDPSRPLHLPE